MSPTPSMTRYAVLLTLSTNSSTHRDHPYKTQLPEQVRTFVNCFIFIWACLRNSRMCSFNLLHLHNQYFHHMCVFVWCYLWSFRNLVWFSFWFFSSLFLYVFVAFYVPGWMRLRLVCGRSRVRSSGPATFFRGDWSCNNFYGLRPPVVSYWRNDVHLVNCLGLSLPRKSVVRLTDGLDMTIAVEWDVKPQNNNNNKAFYVLCYLSG